MCISKNFYEVLEHEAQRQGVISLGGNEGSACSALLSDETCHSDALLYKEPIGDAGKDNFCDDAGDKVLNRKPWHLK